MHHPASRVLQFGGLLQFSYRTTYLNIESYLIGPTGTQVGEPSNRNCGESGPGDDCTSSPKTVLAPIDEDGGMYCLLARGRNDQGYSNAGSIIVSSTL